jgi:integrase
VLNARLAPSGEASVMDRPESRAVRDEPDPRRQLHRFAYDMAAVSARIRPVYEVLRTAGAVEPEVREVFAEMERHRLAHMRQPAGWFARRGPLRVSRDRAAEVLWVLITRKGGKVVTIPLAPRTARAIDLAVGERTDGPVFLGADGRRLDRHGAGRLVRKAARRAGIAKAVTPHTLRHAFITAALDAGVPLRDVQEAASHADPRTTMRYDRARGSLDWHATYIVAAYIAGAAR